MIDEIEIDKRNETRDDAILAAAHRIVLRQGLSALTRDLIADEANLSAASVSNFGRTRITNGRHDRIGYRARVMAALMERAIHAQDIDVIRIGLADGCLKSDDLPDNVREIMG